MEKLGLDWASTLHFHDGPMAFRSSYGCDKAVGLQSVANV